MTSTGLPSRFRLSLVAGLLVAAAGGCGGGTGSLSGTVTFNGRPVTSGTVQVFLADGSTRTSDIAPDGSYAVADLSAGLIQIGVSSPNPKKRYDELVSRAKTEDQKKAVVPPNPAAVRSWVALPEAAARPESSGLAATIKPGDNLQDLALTGVSPAANSAAGGPILPARPSLRQP